LTAPLWGSALGPVMAEQSGVDGVGLISCPEDMDKNVSA